jgi:hypothetical protein
MREDSSLWGVSVQVLKGNYFNNRNLKIKHYDFSPSIPFIFSYPSACHTFSLRRLGSRPTFKKAYLSEFVALNSNTEGIVDFGE